MNLHQHQTTELVSPFDPSVDLESIGTRPEVVCRPTASEAERKICAELRHEVFVVAQSVFDTTDQDARDDDDTTTHLVADIGGVAGGTVRIYRLDDYGLWKGDRLAVVPSLRSKVIGARLVQTAVQTAGELGGSEMIATVQVPNTRFFERLGWRQEGEPILAYGVPHQTMKIALERQWLAEGSC